MVAESEYKDLEDTDEFRSHADICMHCGAEFNIRNGTFILDCQNCGAKSCPHCLDEHGWYYDYATDTGPTVICHDCQNLNESEYEDLEDIDDFQTSNIGGNTCIDCGRFVHYGDDDYMHYCEACRAQNLPTPRCSNCCDRYKLRYNNIKTPKTTIGVARYGKLIKGRGSNRKGWGFVFDDTLKDILGYDVWTCARRSAKKLFSELAITTALANCEIRLAIEPDSGINENDLYNAINTPHIITLCHDHAKDIGIKSISESEYEDLEDVDKFSNPEDTICPRCGSEHGQNIIFPQCQGCGEHFCPFCAWSDDEGFIHDEFDNLTHCPMCDEYKNMEDAYRRDVLGESEYEDLEDIDEFNSDDGEWMGDCNNCGEAVYSTTGYECDDCKDPVCPNCMNEVFKLYRGVRFHYCPKCAIRHRIAEDEYEDLEDIDEFRDPYEYCDSCLGTPEDIQRDIEQDPEGNTDPDLHQCDNCSSLYCAECLPGGTIYNNTLKRKNATHAYTADKESIELGKNSIYDFKIEGGHIKRCPKCRSTEQLSLRESDEYEGLEDVDEFMKTGEAEEDIRPTEVINLDTYGDYQIINTNWDAPIYVAENKAQFEDGMEVAANTFDYTNIPHRQATPQDIAQIPQAVKERLFFSLFYEGGKYDPDPEGTFLESEYEDLEDTDEFRDTPFYHCKVCGDQIAGHGNVSIFHMPAFTLNGNTGVWLQPIFISCNPCINNGETYRYAEQKAKAVAEFIRRWETKECNDFMALEDEMDLSISSMNYRPRSDIDLIYESSEYEDLEDVDEFQDDTLGPCDKCGQTVTEHDDMYWNCDQCGISAHFSCAIPTEQDLKTYEAEAEKFPEEGAAILSSGWFYKTNPKSVSKFTNGQELDLTPRGRWYNNSAIGIHYYDNVLCPICTHEAANNPKMTLHNTVVSLLNESEYEDLEDVDEFQDPDHYTEECSQCGGNFDVNDDGWLCAVCGQPVCPECELSARETAYYSIICSHECMREYLKKRKRDYESQFYTESDEYEDLEDVDEFQDTQLYNLEIYDKDFVRVYSQWYEGQRDPLYAIVSRVPNELSRHQAWVGGPAIPGEDLTTYEYPKDLLINEPEADRLIEVSKEICTSEDVPEEDKEVADQYGQQIGGPRWFET